MMRLRFALGALGCAAVFLAGCQSTPRSGPDTEDIKRGAVIYTAADRKPLDDYAVVEITDRIATYFDTPERPGLGATFGAAGGTSRRVSVPLGIGDIVQITLFESAAGGLFIPAEAGSRPGNYITLPPQTVDSDGSLTVPYAGRVRAAGRTPAQVEDDIEKSLANRAIEPQAVITVTDSRASQVSVLGDVNKADKLSVNLNGERILDVISRAGGISSPAKETYVTLQRNGKSGTVYFDRLVSNPKENIFVAPGDTLFVNRDRRTYLAFGASGQNGRFDFDEFDLTLAEAVAKAGGLLDNRAEPSSVFLYRKVSSSVAHKIGLPIGTKDDGTFPVIFRLNLRDPASFFLAQKFAMQDQDILYVDNAKTVEYQKVFEVIGDATATVTTPVATVRTLSR